MIFIDKSLLALCIFFHFSIFHRYFSFKLLSFFFFCKNKQSSLNENKQTIHSWESGTITYILADSKAGWGVEKLKWKDGRLQVCPDWRLLAWDILCGWFRSIFGFLWLVPCWKQRQKTGKLSVIDQALIIWAKCCRSWGLVS